METRQPSIAFNTRTHAIGVICGWCDWTHNDMVIPVQDNKTITKEDLLRVGIMLIFDHCSVVHNDLSEDEVNGADCLIIDSEYLLNGEEGTV